MNHLELHSTEVHRICDKTSYRQYKDNNQIMQERCIRVIHSTVRNEGYHAKDEGHLDFG